MLCAFTIFPETDIIPGIKQYCKDIKNAIAECEKDYCNYYCNEIILNKHKNPWRAVGINNKHFYFWYNDDPGFVHRFRKEEKTSVLVMVKAEEEYSSFTEYAEYFFKDDKLVYFHIHKECAADNQGTTDYILYFENDTCIQFLENGKSREVVVSIVENTIHVARFFKKFFLETFIE